MPFRVRPGTAADVPAVARLFLAAFSDDMLLDLCHPKRDEYPEDCRIWYERHFHARYWGDEEQIFLVVVEDPDPNPNPPSDSHAGPTGATAAAAESDEGRGEGDVDRIVAFAWFRRPWHDASKRAAHEGWLTTRGWVKPLINRARQTSAYLWPSSRSLDRDFIGAVGAMHHDTEQTLEEQDPSPPRRKTGWYLSTLGVDPALQGKGLGRIVIKHALANVIDQEDTPCWLIALNGVEPFYERLGFVTVGWANRGALAKWDGGAVMIRDEASG